MQLHRIRLVLALATACALSTGCVVYEPVPVVSSSSFDRAWNAAHGALQDAGVNVTSSDVSTGQIRGAKDGIPVTVSVVRQADGSTQVRFDAKGSERDPGLGNRFSQAYDRRMGR